MYPIIHRKPDNFDESLGRAPLFPNEEVIKTPTKILEELQRKRGEEQPDFRYSIGQLPNWAKAKVSTDRDDQSYFVQLLPSNYMYSLFLRTFVLSDVI